jgi:hypothetical protein
MARIANGHPRNGLDGCIVIIKSIQFFRDVEIGGELGQIPRYSHAKHDKNIKVERDGSWILLHVGHTSPEGVFKPTGTVRRISITNIADIEEHHEPPIYRAESGGMLELGSKPSKARQ